jgi:hypothetical protein
VDPIQQAVSQARTGAGLEAPALAARLGASRDAVDSSSLATRPAETASAEPDPVVTHQLPSASNGVSSQRSASDPAHMDVEDEEGEASAEPQYEPQSIKSTRRQRMWVSAASHAAHSSAQAAVAKAQAAVDALTASTPTSSTSSSSSAAPTSSSPASAANGSAQAPERAEALARAHEQLEAARKALDAAAMRMAYEAVFAADAQHTICIQQKQYHIKW